MESSVRYWVVLRHAKTGKLLTFKSFADYDDAETHKAQLEDVGDPDDQIIEMTIEILPLRQSPK